MNPTRQLIPAPAARASAPTRLAPSRDTGRVSAARGDLGGYLLQFQRSHGNQYVQRLIDPGRSAPGTGIPAGIKAALEQRSGVDLSGVRVHYNSPHPARLGALACTKGSVIHVGPGQEKYLAHEAWHVVQQRQGRVRATRNEAGIWLNDDPRLEREANSLERVGLAAPAAPDRPSAQPVASEDRRPGTDAPIQLKPADVDRWLAQYRKKRRKVADADWQKLLVIFAEWENVQQKADKYGGGSGAGKIRKHAKEEITKDLIEALNNNEEISAPVRRTLVGLWNNGTSQRNRVAFKAPPTAGPMSLESGGSSLWEPLSPRAASYQYDLMEMSQGVPELELSPGQGEPVEKEKKRKRKERSEPEADPPAKAPRKSKTLVMSSGRRGGQEAVYEVATASEAALIIRSFTKQARPIPKGFKIIWGQGMFVKGSFNDIIFTLLTESEPGVVSRQGKVAPWIDILKDVPKRQKPSRFFRDLQAGLSGPPPSDPALALMAGAMICDVKHGINAWIQLLSELYPMLMELERQKADINIPKLFMDWYEYAAPGGRDLRKRKLRPSYRGQHGRVETTEWYRPTLIPSIGGFQFRGDTNSSGLQVWELVINYVGDPKQGWKFWNLAMTNTFFYDRLAEMYRKSRQLVPGKK